MKSSQIKSAVMILMNFLKHHLRTKNKWQIIDPHVNSNCWYLIPINYYLTTATGSLRSKNPNNPWRYIPHLTPRSARAEVGRVERSAICETVNLGDVFLPHGSFSGRQSLMLHLNLTPQNETHLLPNHHHITITACIWRSCFSPAMSKQDLPSWLRAWHPKISPAKAAGRYVFLGGGW